MRFCNVSEPWGALGALVKILVPFWLLSIPPALQRQGLVRIKAEVSVVCFTGDLYECAVTRPSTASHAVLWHGSGPRNTRRYKHIPQFYVAFQKPYLCM